MFLQRSARAPSFHLQGQIMNHPVCFTGATLVALAALFAVPEQSTAQEPGADELEEVVVTGSRIRRDPLNEAAAVLELGTTDLDRTGLTNLGDALQQLPVTSSAINSQFNVPGNSGFPQDGSGIGAGAVEVALRNVGAKRTLVLVDGKRWIPGSSASGVPSAVDLNTIPDNVIQRIEILQDGASAIYGADAIGGVVNIITTSDYEGFRADMQIGEYLSENDGESYAYSALWGGGSDTTHLVLSAGYTDERGVETASRSRSAFPTPDATSCDVPGTLCSSFTPQGRFVLGPNFGFADVTLNDGVLNDGVGNIPVFDPNNPNSGDFHTFSGADRFNFNAPGFNFLRTPNQRLNLYASATHELAENLDLSIKATYTNRESSTKAAPEPLCLGNGCGNRINDQFFISALNPYNPFGVDLSVANGNLEFFARRPLESGPRLYFQNVNTYFLSATVAGEFELMDRSMYWDLTGSYGDNHGVQEKFNSHNAAKLQIAMGDPAVCAAVPNCVPFNFFGGQGPDGTGSITQEMLDFVTFTQRDVSEQTMRDFVFNLTGDLVELPGGGQAGFAVGAEFREHEGFYRPDPIAASGETAGIPAGATRGGFDVTEFYGEISLPLLEGSPFADYLELNLAARASDYSTFGSESTWKTSALWRPLEDLSLRASYSTGLRAPGIGELFGGAAREDFTFLDPCADVLAQAGSANGGRDTPQPQNIIDNCAALGVPVALTQANPQLSAVSAGNATLDPETSDNWTVGLVWSPGFDNLAWVEGLTTSIDFYNLEIDQAIQGRDPADVITACVLTLDPLFCSLVPRTSSGQLGVVDNQLQNIGGIETSGIDFSLAYTGPDTGYGRFSGQFNASYVNEYKEITTDVGGGVTVTDLTGRHTDETFQRAFPEWRWTTNFDWLYEAWGASLTFRWVDEMTLDSGATLDSALFTDAQVRYTPEFADNALTVSLGINNLLDEDPPVCFPCGVIGLSLVAHDLPGRMGYLRVTYEQQ
jgi:iron complex outermembrane recepter protein